MIIRPIYGDAKMCVSDDSMAIVLDASTSDTDGVYNTDFSTTWHKRLLGAGILVGSTACLSTAFDSMALNTVYYGDNDDGILIDNGAEVIGGELNGPNCFCRITHPVLSLWIHVIRRDSLSDCSKYCVHDCFEKMGTGNLEKLFKALIEDQG